MEKKNVNIYNQGAPTKGYVIPIRSPDGVRDRVKRYVVKRAMHSPR